MVATSAGWRSPAPYLYALHLDDPELAWEYLRRNPDYRRDWDSGLDHLPDDDRPARWGLRLLEDPRRDAREAEPAWRPEIYRAVLIQPDADPPQDALPFRFWSIPGRKSLVHDGKRLILTSQQAGRTLRMNLAPDLEDGQPHAYAVRAGNDLKTAQRVTEAWLALGSAPLTAVTSGRPDRIAVMHMRIMQALDGAAAGASQRDIANAIFGVDQMSDRWHADDALRAQVRHLLRRGKALMQGGYRDLLGNDSPRQGDSHLGSESP